LVADDKDRVVRDSGQIPAGRYQRRRAVRDDILDPFWEAGRFLGID
jgi:hypothetical protein